MDAAVIADGQVGLDGADPNGPVGPATIFVQVVAAASSAVVPTRYEVEIDFAQDAQPLQTFVNDTLGPDVRETCTSSR